MTKVSTGETGGEATVPVGRSPVGLETRVAPSASSVESGQFSQQNNAPQTSERMPIPWQPGEPQPTLRDGQWRGIRAAAGGGLEGLPRRPQSQQSLKDQLAELHPVAVRLGLYDAADFLQRIIEERRK